MSCGTHVRAGFVVQDGNLTIYKVAISEREKELCDTHVAMFHAFKGQTAQACQNFKKKTSSRAIAGCSECMVRNQGMELKNAHTLGHSVLQLL